MSDKDRIHRWITQADFEEQISKAEDRAFLRGMAAMREYLAVRLPEVGLPPSTAEIIRSLPDPEDV